MPGRFLGCFHHAHRFWQLGRPWIAWILLAPLSSFFNAAWPQPIGVSSLLNPEGSRLFPNVLVYPRHAGKPNPKWRVFDWMFLDVPLQNTAMRLYFYPEESSVIQFALPEIKNEILNLTEVFHFSPTQTFSYLLFNSHRDFQQTNIFNISEGVQGVTSTQEPTMAIPYWGEPQAFRHISAHELVHQFQIQKIGTLAEAHTFEVQSQIPLWFIEGMAEYYSLKGIDPESRLYVIDVMLYPDPERKYSVPKYFEEGALGFVNTYKLGQAKIDFLETQFGQGTAQHILESAGKQLGRTVRKFEDLLAQELHQPVKEIEARWTRYLEDTFLAEAKKLPQSMDELETVPNTGDTLDLFDVSPDGIMIATRELDVLSGVTSIQLIDLENEFQKHEVAHDHKPNLLRLGFMQLPALSLSNEWIAYGVATIWGPEIEYRKISRNSSGQLQLGQPRRILVRQKGIVEVSSLAISPDGSRLAFVGLNEQGHQNIYVAPIESTDGAIPLKQVTHTYFYSWRNLIWSRSGVFLASDLASHDPYNLFKLNLETGTFTPVTASQANQLAPDEPDSSPSLIFQSWESGSSQIHQISQGTETRLTGAKTALMNPKLRRGFLYTLGLRRGRYHLFRIPKDKLLKGDVHSVRIPQSPLLPKPWVPQVISLADKDIKDYRPFATSGFRLENLGGFVGTGGAGGVSATVSDLMRDYSISFQSFFLGQRNIPNSQLFLTSNRGRTQWTAGAYFIQLPRIDTAFDRDNRLRFFIHQEYGTLFAIQHPLGAFLFTDAVLRMGIVNRSQFSDPNLLPQFEALNPGAEFMINPVFRLGHDQILYESFSGPLKGFSLLLEADTSFFPGRGSVSERIRFDAAYYQQLVGSTVLAFQGVAGASWGGPFNNPFYVSSDDLFRAYTFGDPRLIGSYLFGGKVEFRFPIGELFKFPPLRGLLAYDHGTVFNRSEQAIDRQTSSLSAGLSFNIPPINFNFLLSFPIRTASGPSYSPVFHFTLRYLYL